MRDTSFLGFGYASSPEPIRVVAQLRKGCTATDQVRQWLDWHPGYHTIPAISEGSGVSIRLVNSALSNLYARGVIVRECAHRVSGKPQRYAWRVA